MDDNAVRYLALIAASQARIEGYKAKNALALYEGQPPFYTEDYFQSEASDLETYARELLV